MTQPDSGHPILVTPNPRRVRVRLGGIVIADTSRALTLTEAGYRAVQYIPRADADMTRLTRTGHHTHCPYKGEASYFTITAGGKTATNAVWSYEQPFPAVATIKDRLAFYADRVDAIEEE